MWFRIFPVAVVFSVVLAGQPLWGQFDEDPFATQADGSVVDAATADETEAEAEKPDELVRQLESKASRGGLYRAQAIGSLARLGAWPAVNRWLARIDEQDDPTELAAAAKEIGADMLLRISLQTDLSDQSRSAIDKLSAAAKSVRQSPERVRAAIAALNSSDLDQSIAAARTLAEGGDVAIAELVASLSKGLPAGHWDKVLDVLRSLGGGAAPLGQLALYGNDSVRTNAIAGLWQLDRSAAVNNLVSSLLTSKVTDGEREFARQIGLVVTDDNRDAAVAKLARDLIEKRRIAKTTPNDLQPSTLWTVGSDRQSVAPSRSRIMFQHYRDAYDAAQRLLRAGTVSAPIARNALSADLEYRVLVNPDWGTPEEINQVRRNHVAAASTVELLAAIDGQREQRHVPAVLGLIRMLGDQMRSDSSNTGDTFSIVFIGSGGQPSPLVQAVRDSDPRVRYEAASAIASALKSGQSPGSFPGASYFRSTLAEMLELRARPTALVLETRPTTALRQESILDQLGFRSQVVTSAMSAERAVAAGGDLRMIVSKLGIADASAAELVDRIRRLPKGRRVPIVFYDDDSNSEKTRRNAQLLKTSTRWVGDETPAIYLADLPGGASAFVDVITEADSKRRLPAMNASDRLEAQATARDFLFAE